MYSFGKVGYSNFSANKTWLEEPACSPSVGKSNERISDCSNNRELSQLSEADIQKRSQKNKGLPDPKRPRKPLSCNSKFYNRKKTMKKSNFPRLERVFSSSNNKNGANIPKSFEKKLELIGLKTIQPINTPSIDEIVSSNEESEDGVKPSPGMFSGPSSSKICSKSRSPDSSRASQDKDRSFTSNISENEFHISFEKEIENDEQGEQELGIIWSSSIEKFGDNVKSASIMQNLVKSGSGKRSSTLNLRVVSNPSDGRYSNNEVYNIDWSSSESDDGTITNISCTANKVFAGKKATPKHRVLVTDNLIQTNKQENLGTCGPLTSEADTTDVIFTEDYNIVWSSSESEDGAWNNKSFPNKNESWTKKSKYAESNAELDLLIQAIEKDCRRSNKIREKYTMKKGGYSEKFKSAIGKARMDLGFLNYEQNAGILQGMSAVVTKKEMSYGVCTANVRLENDTRCQFFLDRRSANCEDKLVSFVNSSRFYTVHGIDIFIQPNKVVSA